MGMQTAQAAQPISQQQPVPQATQQVDSTMSGAPHQNMGKGSGKSGGQQYTGSGKPNEFVMPSTTNAATSGQPQMGQPNSYPNTIQPWDNANIQPKQSSTGGGKGKGY